MICVQSPVAGSLLRSSSSSSSEHRSELSMVTEAIIRQTGDDAQVRVIMAARGATDNGAYVGIISLCFYLVQLICG